MRNIAQELEPTSDTPAPCIACSTLTDNRPPAGLCLECLSEANAWLEWLDTHSECHSLCMDDATDRARMAVCLAVAEPRGGGR